MAKQQMVLGWPLWCLLAVTVFIALTIGAKQLEQMVKGNQLKEFNAWMIYYTLYVSSCIFSCLAFITIFRRFVTAQKGWWTSLADNAYLIYLIHYIFVIWTQFLLMDYDMPAFLKFLITFVSALALSWAVSNLLRKNKLISKYL